MNNDDERDLVEEAHNAALLHPEDETNDVPRYVVWVSIEMQNVGGIEFQDADLPDEVAAFDTLADASAFAQALLRLITLAREI